MISSEDILVRLRARDIELEPGAEFGPMPRIEPEPRIEPATTVETIQWIERELGISIPPSLKEWWQHCNGFSFTYGNAYGVNTEDPGGDIRGIYRLDGLDAWRQRNWIPVADDGCGNYYLLVRDEIADLFPVCFVEMLEDPFSLHYAASSGIHHFLWGFVSTSVGRDWPFNRSEALALDPDLARVQVAPLPWTLVEPESW